MSTLDPTTAKVSVAEAFDELYHPHRYKAFYGGRGAAKSWAFADALLVQGIESPLRILCTRELQKSIKDSVHKLLSDRIAANGFQTEYRVLDTEIRGRNGSQFIFSGVKHNTTELKSLEGIDRCWVEEAERVSDESWRVIIPTIRKPGSEIWLSFNVRLKTDSTYQRFVVNPPPDAYVKKVSYRDNPWFPDVLKAELEHLKATDYDEYLHVWEGELKTYADGAYYSKELAAAKEEGRVSNVPYDPILKVYTVWDLGVGDATAIWFAQLAGKEIRLIDFYQASGEGLPHYAKVLQEKPYVYGGHYAPHDIRVRELGSGKSRIEIAESLGISFDVVNNISIDDGIAAVRATLPKCWFDQNKCSRGIDALSNYRKEWDEDRMDFRVKPVHDWSSHASDAFRYLAVGLAEKVETKEYVPTPYHSVGGWMR